MSPNKIEIRSIYKKIKMKRLLIIFLIFPFPFVLKSQNNYKFFNNTNTVVDYGYNMYYENSQTILDGINIGLRFTKILPLDVYDAFHVGLKLGYHSRNILISEIGNVKQQNLELGTFFGWNDAGDQVYISSKYAFLISENKHLIGAELRIEPFDKVIHKDFELMFYASPHIIVKREFKSMSGITLGFGIVYHLKKLNIFDPETFYTP